MAGHAIQWEDTAPDNRERFMALWDAGVPTRAMARQLGMSLSTLWMVRRRLKLPARANAQAGCANAQEGEHAA